MNCRHCKSPLRHTFIDLGLAPPSNAYLSEADLALDEEYYPLKVKVCDQCWLVQTEDYTKADQLFKEDYAYFSSTSRSWLEHAETYCAQITTQLNLGAHSHVIEVASNDGYLLKNFVAAGIPCLGIEPTDSTAAVAENRGIPVLREFFGEALGKQLAHQGKQADLIIGNNVYAHVPDINDFTLGLKAALKEGGTITLEFPHLMRLIEYAQFDTIYHEHFSYLSLYTVSRIMESSGLRVWDVEALSTHGGSLRVYICHEDDPRKVRGNVQQLLGEEQRQGLQSLQPYIDFQPRADKIKQDLVAYLQEAKGSGKRIGAYGAAAKGNTLLNYAGITPDLIPFVCDSAPSKQGKYLPGSRIPIRPPSFLHTERLDEILILPWNIAREIKVQLADLEADGTKFVIAVPELKTI